MNLQEMTNYIKTRYPTELQEHEFSYHLNEAYRDVATLFTPDVTETHQASGTFQTSSGEAVYMVPELSRTIKQIHMDSSTGGTTGPMVRLRSMMEESLMYPRELGVPVRWYPFGFKESTGGGVYQEFGLDPVPDTDVERDLHVLYEPVPVELVNNADEPEYVPEEYHHLICWKTLAVLAGNQQDYNTAQNWNALYTNAYNEILLRLGRSRHANFPEAARRVKGI